MKLLLIGTCRQPTMNVGSNGLGRHTYDFLTKFKEKSNVNLTTFLHKDSKLEWNDIRQYHYEHEVHNLQRIIDHIEQEKYDVVLDFSHWHLLSNAVGDKYPIINFIHDEECRYSPPNCMLGNEWQKKTYTTGRIFTTGINFSKYKLYEKKKDYFSFCGKLELRKGYDIAYDISKAAGIRTIFAGPDVDGRANQLGEWMGEISNHQKFCDFVGESKALFYPSRADAGGMGIWEAMAMGTPTITTSQSGAQYNVIHGVTGFVVSNIDEAIQATKDVSNLNPADIRKVCETKWDFNKNFDIMFKQIEDFCNGDRW